MSADAGWKSDPYGRYAMRYFDGGEWTEHVVDGGGTQLVDPMGRSTVIPFVLPSSATGGASTWPPPDPSTRRT
jgi:hypothetical protein